MKFSYTLIKRLLPKLPPKQKLVDVFGLRVFEIEEAKGDMIDVKLPANRYSDAVSHIGLAREAATVFHLPFKLPVARIVNVPEKQGLVHIKIEDQDRCIRYNARYFELTKKIGSSPAWLKKILTTCGIRPINAIVDIMNYVMLETGQPLHAFDAAKLETASATGKANIMVRKARKGERLETLDGQMVEFNAGELVIADANDPVAIAGIKGGKASGVTSTTKAIVVEAANFDWVTIQKTARALKLHTDAAARFGHGISPALVDMGLDRATELLSELGAVLKDSVQYYPHPAGDEVLSFRTDRYEALVGAPITEKEATAAFAQLGFEVSPAKKGSLSVRIPAWRNDITIPEDLIEEAARVMGYDTLAAKAPYVSLGEAHEEDVVVLKQRVREFLTHARLDEVNLHSFIPRDAAVRALKADYPDAHELVELENPLSAEYECMRPSIWPGLVQALEMNRKYFEEVRIFEIGKVFAIERGKVAEALHCGILLARKKESYFSEAKGIIEDLLNSFGVRDVMFVERGSRLYIEADDALLGHLEPHEFEKGWVGAMGEMNLDRLLTLVSEERRFKPLPKYPAIVRDISLLLDDDVRIGRILETIQNAGAADVVDVDLLDEYKDETLGGKQSLTFRIIFQSEEKTLTDAEVNREIEKIVHALKKEVHADVR